jgi:hypothetical protein
MLQCPGQSLPKELSSQTPILLVLRNPSLFPLEQSPTQQFLKLAKNTGKKERRLLLLIIHSFI